MSTFPLFGLTRDQLALQYARLVSRRHEILEQIYQLENERDEIDTDIALIDKARAEAPP